MALFLAKVSDLQKNNCVVRYRLQTWPVTVRTSVKDYFQLSTQEPTHLNIFFSECACCWGYSNGSQRLVITEPNGILRLHSALFTYLLAVGVNTVFNPRTYWSWWLQRSVIPRSCTFYVLLDGFLYSFISVFYSSRPFFLSFCLPPFYSFTNQGHDGNDLLFVSGFFFLLFCFSGPEQ